MKAVLFDLDGTLLDSIPGILESFHHVLDEFVAGHRFSDRDMIRRIGEPVPVQMLYFSDGDIPLAEKMTAAYRAHNFALLSRVPLYAGVEEMLEGLASRGFALGLVTSKSRRGTMVTIERFGLDRWLPLVLTADDTPKHKPDPTPLLMAGERLAVAPQSVAYVGDSTFDMLCAKAAGSHAVAALWGPFDREDLERTAPDRLVESFEALLALPELERPS